LVGVRQALPAVQRLGDAQGPQWQATVSGPFPTKNKFNIEVDTWSTYQILN